MNYIEYDISIQPISSEVIEILIANLSEIGFESFVEIETGIQAYIPENIHEREMVRNTFESLKALSAITYSKKTIEQQNWNAVWESNFEPIFIDGKIAVVAPFHEVKENYQYKILIEPKMSFGTGHHETTSLVMSQMLEIDFKGKRVLDMGCGTGILAILAGMLGATSLSAIDNDEWAYNNAIENFGKNNISNASILLGDAGSIPATEYDIVIANINRNILLQDIRIYVRYLKPGGLMLLSGFYAEDIDLIAAECAQYGLKKHKVNEKNRWVGALFIKGL